MEAITHHTRISTLLKAHPDALEQIVAISPVFAKLRNPILRRVMAPRTSIEMAARIAGVSPVAFFDRMRALGLTVADTPATEQNPQERSNLPDVFSSLAADRFHVFDVRPILEGGDDPLKQILQKLSEIPQGEVLTIINTFVPEPLIRLLGDKGFVCGWQRSDDALIHTHILVTPHVKMPAAEPLPAQSDAFRQSLRRFNTRVHVLDVRHMEMPGPMHAILDSLETLPAYHALLVHHKRIPVFLLPELQDRGFTYVLHTISDQAVDMLIFREEYSA